MKTPNSQTADFNPEQLKRLAAFMDGSLTLGEAHLVGASIAALTVLDSTGWRNSDTFRNLLDAVNMTLAEDYPHA